MSELENKDEADKDSDDGVYIFLVSWILAFLGALISGYQLKETAAVSPFLGLIITIIFISIRGLVRKILKK